MDLKDLRVLVKNIRDQLRKDAGLTSDTDRIPQLSWILFLKCLNDNISNKNPKTPELQWTSWTSLSEKEIIPFVNTILLPTLSTPNNSEFGKLTPVIFSKLTNKIESGSVMKNVISLVNKINFTSTDDIHVLAKIYEDILIEMRDASGTNGEFYTPRPLIRFIVEQIDPKIINYPTMLDPASGTGGFLVETYDYLKPQCKTKAQLTVLNNDMLYGIEKKATPYLLCLMNLILHGISSPNILLDNTLTTDYIISNEQYDLILTNPPFGGEEESKIKDNLPYGINTTNTALLFLLYITYKLKKNGSCAIILPNGPLFASGSATKIKEILIENFNLHTIIRLPKSVFAPYTEIETNILFFTNNGSTKIIDYYEMKIPSRIKSFTKTNPIMQKDFIEVASWFKNRKKSINSWSIKKEEIKNFDLDIPNPNLPDIELDFFPHSLIEEIIEEQNYTIEILKRMKDILDKSIPRPKK